MQTLVPLSASPDEDIQLKVLKGIRSFIPGLKGATPVDVAFVWSYIAALIQNSTKTVCVMQIV